MLGIARNSPAIVDYLDNCPAVQSYAEDGDMIRFKWEGQEPSNAPDGVCFDLAMSPF